MGKSDLSITGNVHLGNAEVSVLQFLFRKSEERGLAAPAGPCHDKQQEQQTMDEAQGSGWSRHNNSFRCLVAKSISINVDQVVSIALSLDSWQVYMESGLGRFLDFLVPTASWHTRMAPWLTQGGFPFPLPGQIYLVSN